MSRDAARPRAATDRARCRNAIIAAATAAIAMAGFAFCVFLVTSRVIDSGGDGLGGEAFLLSVAPFFGFVLLVGMIAAAILAVFGLVDRRIWAANILATLALTVFGPIASIYLQSWAPVVLSFCGVAYIMLHLNRAARKIPAGMCANCEYDLEGLAVSSACPECGWKSASGTPPGV